MRAEGGESEDPLHLERELPALLRFLRRLVGRAQEAEELAQEVVARALRSRERFDSSRPPGPYLRRAGLRAFLDRRDAMQRDPLAGAESADEHVAPAAGDALERRDELVHWLAKLSPVEREALVRFHARGESIAEIARALDAPEGTVKSHLHRARRRLAQLALERGEEDR